MSLPREGAVVSWISAATGTQFANGTRADLAREGWLPPALVSDDGERRVVQWIDAAGRRNRMIPYGPSRWQVQILARPSLMSQRREPVTRPGSAQPWTRQGHATATEAKAEAESGGVPAVRERASA